MTHRDIKIVIMLAVLMVLMLGAQAPARDFEGKYINSPLRPWFDSLKSGKGPCCSDADGTAVSDPDWTADGNGHYRVRIEGTWYDVPDEAVLKQPNLYGQTMVWPNPSRGIDNKIVKMEIRCFIVGTLI